MAHNMSLMNESREMPLKCNGSAELSVTNCSDSVLSSERPESVTALVEKYTVPIICILGLLGNSLSLFVFFKKSLRTKSCSLFLAVRSISDNGFLVTLLMIWTSSVFDLRLSRISGICQITVFLTYVFGCLSVWLVVFVTTENYVRICKPFLVNTFCNTTKAKCAVLVLIICVLCCYNFPLWTMTKECVPNQKHYSFIKVMVYTDSLLTLVVPIIVMAFLMSQIAMSSLSSWKRRRRLSSSSAQRITNLTTKVTTMLLAVTLIFITLNLPSHVVRLRLLIVSFIRNQLNVTTSTDLTVQSISQLLYYLSLSINFFVYYLFGGTFRKTFNDIFRRKIKSRHVYAQTDNSTLSTSRYRRVGLPLQHTSDGESSNNNLLKLSDTVDESLPRRLDSSVF